MVWNQGRHFKISGQAAGCERESSELATHPWLHLITSSQMKNESIPIWLIIRIWSRPESFGKGLDLCFSKAPQVILMTSQI